jgi:hypothetical protein
MIVFFGALPQRKIRNYVALTNLNLAASRMFTAAGLNAVSG